MQNFKKILIVSILFIFFFIININSYANTISNDLSNSFFRLHIIANSNSDDDQALKLKIRDTLIDYMSTIIKDNYNKEEIINICYQNLNKFDNLVKKIITENGYSYNVKLSIGQFNFPTKHYGNISIPAGLYDGLKVEIGNASGENWWCSLFPPLCFIDISSGTIDSKGENYLKQNLSNEEFSLITSNSRNIKFKFKFKIIEILNKKNIL